MPCSLAPSSEFPSLGARLKRFTLALDSSGKPSLSGWPCINARAPPWSGLSSQGGIFATPLFWRRWASFIFFVLRGNHLLHLRARVIRRVPFLSFPTGVFHLYEFWSGLWINLHVGSCMGWRCLRCWASVWQLSTFWRWRHSRAH